MNFKKGLILSVCVLCTLMGNSQVMQSSADNNNNGFQKEKLFFGGNVGFSFGSSTYINLSPLIGYRFSDMFAAGAQINGIYESRKYYGATNLVIEKDRSGMVGLGLFGRIYPIPQLFLQVQPEMNYVMGKVKEYNPENEYKFHTTAPAFLVGGGYSQSVGRNNAFVIMILYDILQDDRSPYGNNAIFRIGADIGF